MKTTKISNGITLFKQDKFYDKEETISFSHSFNSLIIQINLKGTNKNQNFLADYESEAKEDNTIMNVVKEFDGVIKTPKNTHRQVLSLMLEKDFLLKSLPKNKISDNIINFFETKKIYNKLNDNKINITSKALAYDIFNTPYTDNLDKIYTESKVLALIHNEFTNLFKQKEQDNSIIFSKHDKESIYEARDILINNLSNPPSMKELAKIVRINDLKLKVGFHKYFNQTPYSISLEYRLQEAKKLLSKSDMNINEIAIIVGYKQAASFSRAFSKRFGIPPKELMKSRKYYY